MENWVVTRRPAQGRLDVPAYFKSAPAVMVGVVRLSLLEMIILQRVLKPQRSAASSLSPLSSPAICPIGRCEAMR